MSISISPLQLQQIYDRAEYIYPEECCGILLGKITGVAKTVVEIIPTNNVWGESQLGADLHLISEIARTKHSRYTIDPQAIFQAQKRARSIDLDIIGFFHSHPDNSAIPSTCDRAQAWEVYSYPIVSVIGGKVSDIQSWVLDRKGVFQLEEIQQVEPI
jgi:proteasome lid subunit RPN8/RPN11